MSSTNSLLKASATTSEHERPLQRMHVDDGHHTSKRSLFTAWSLEFLSFLLSLLALVAIIITLYVHEGRPLPQWPHLISINALIAIFTAIMKAALLVPIAEGLTRLKWLWFIQPRRFRDLESFDSASRGPWGSLKLMLKLQGRHVAALGAFITVLSIAVDPFSQQILAYHDCAIPIDGPIARVPVTNYYNQGYYFANGDSKALDANMTAGMYLGLINPPVNASSSISSTCSTGNCTISTSEHDTYSSVAMCSQCVDISDLIVNNTAAPGYNDTFGLNYTLPSGCYIGEMYVGNVANSLVVLNPNQSDVTQDLIQVETLLKNGVNADSDSWTPFATRCSLKPCVNTYVSNITNNILDEKLISSKPMTFYGASFIYYFSLVLNETFSSGKRVDCSSTPEAKSPTDICTTAGYTPIDLAATAPTSHCWPQECVFTYGVNPTGGAQSLILELFTNSNVTFIDAIPGGNPWSVATWNNGQTNLSIFENAWSGLANQMTSVMRQKGDNSTQPLVTGTVLGLQTCIGVRWSWLSFPAALLFLTGVFFIVTIGKVAASATRHVWKSSSLVLLFHGLNEAPLREDEAPIDQDSEDAASRLVGQLRVGSEGFAFEQVDNRTKGL